MMDSQTRQALEASIKHWQENATAERWEDASASVGSCALCTMFFYSSCRGCPVALHTQKQVCRDTPYQDAYNALRDWGENTDSERLRAHFRDAAQKELDFLISLRPAEEKDNTPGTLWIDQGAKMV